MQQQHQQLLAQIRRELAAMPPPAPQRTVGANAAAGRKHTTEQEQRPYDAHGALPSQDEASVVHWPSIETVNFIHSS